jgi:peptidoglycan hydrolase-like protein with peptidoglycan-binding domain
MEPAKKATIALVSLFLLLDVIALSSLLKGDVSSTPPGVHAAAIAGAGSGLIIHYMFDEGSGSSVADSVGGGSGSLGGNPTWAAGYLGESVSFDGNGDYIQIPSVPTIASPYTQAFWFNPALLGTPQGLIAHGLGAGNNMVFYDGSRIQITSASDGTFRTWCNKSIGAGELGAWHHVVIIIDSTTDASQWNCFYDGVDVGVVDSDNSGTYGNPGTTDWTIGAYYNNSYWFNGKIDDVRVYNRALSTSEVSELYAYTGGGGSPSPSSVNGSCGSSNNTCVAGSLSDQTDSATEYLWQCVGSNGGTTASCSANIPSNPTSPTDTTAPIISSVAANSITSTGATISWTTDESSDSQVEYGLTTSYGNSTPLNSNPTAFHGQTLSGLSSNTLYHYRVKSRDSSGNLATGSDNTFATPVAASGPVVSGSIVTAASCSQSDVQAAINAASTGSTVNVPAGNCTWSTSANVTKALSIIGAGSGSGGTKLTATPALPDGFFTVANLTSSSLLRISGFNFDAVNWTPPWIIKMYQNNALDSIRIDHNVFNQSGVAQIEIGGSKGVIDHNLFHNGDKAISFTAGSRSQADASWATMTAGTGDALFIEDNQITDDAAYTGPYGQEKIGTYNGGKLVIRYNNFDATAFPLTDPRDGVVNTFTPIMTHGSACGGCSTSSHGYWQTTGSDARRGQSIVEIYNNTMLGKRIDFLVSVRGSSNLIFNNTIQMSTSWPSVIGLSEEEYNAEAQWVPPRTTWPAEDQIHNTFIWNNTRNGVPIPVQDSLLPNNPYIQLNRDYFMHEPQASGGREVFVCAGGIIQCNGAAGSYPTDGNMYATKGTMVFTSSGPNAYYPYTPYVYPHPLVSGTPAPAATPVPSPNPTSNPTNPSTPTLASQAPQVITSTSTCATSSSIPSFFAFTQTLSLGTTHPEVKTLQQLLNSNGYTVSLTGPGSKGSETTTFGPATERAVKALQSKYKITPTGTVGSITRLVLSTLPFKVTTLSNCASTPSSTFKPLSSGYVFTLPLDIGARNEDVRQLQIFLSTLPGIYPEKLITGTFGPLTQAAVKRFQLQYNLTTPTSPAYGFVGPATRAKLNSLIK